MRRRDAGAYHQPSVRNRFSRVRNRHDVAEPVVTTEKGIDWDGTPASIGAGIYRADLPGTCEPGEVHAPGLEADPSNLRLAEFVRCAAMELESQGYFATRTLSGDPRWSRGSIYVFGLDTYGNTLLGAFKQRYQIRHSDHG